MFQKPKSELDSDLLESFSPYMVSRYLSFHKNGAFADYCNETLNTYQGIFDEDDLFKFYDHIIPKTKRCKLQYVKKPAKDTKKEEYKEIPDFYSKRELKYLTNHDD